VYTGYIIVSPLFNPFVLLYYIVNPKVLGIGLL